MSLSCSDAKPIASKVKSKNVRLLLIGDGLSTFGSWIDFLAILTLAAYAYHVTPYLMAVISATGLLPGILLAPYIGRICDRHDAKALLLISLVIRVSTTAAILLTHDFYLFLGLVGLRSVFSSFLVPAINVMAARSVPSDERTRFYSTLNIVNSLAKIAAPMVGTVFSSVGSEAVALVMSALLTAASFATFLPVRLIRAKPANASAPPRKPAAGDAGAPSLLPLLYLGSVYALYVHMVNNLVPVVLERSGFDKALLGILVGSAGAGNILSGLWLRRRRDTTDITLGTIVRPSLVQAAGFALLGQLVGLHTAYTPYLLPLLFLSIGVFATRHTVALSVFCSEVYGATMGRATATLQSFQSAMLLIAPLVGAYVLEHWGPKWLFGAAAVAALAGYSLVPLLSPLNPKTGVVVKT